MTESPVRSRESDTERRRQRFDDGDLRANPTTLFRDGEHDLGHTVAARLAREAVDERAVDQAADDRRDDEDRRAQERHQGIDGVLHHAAVLVAGKQHGEPDDEVAEQHGARAGARADADREGQQAGRAPVQPVVEALARAARHPQWMADRHGV